MTNYSPSGLWEGVQQDPAIKGSWGTPNSGNMTLVDTMVNGTSPIDLTGLSALTLTVVNGGADQRRPMLLNFFGAPLSSCPVTIPNVPKIGWAVNLTTGGFPVVLTSGGGTTATIPADGFWHLYSADGSGNVVLPILSAGGGASGVIGTSLSVTGNGSITGTLTVNQINVVTANITGPFTVPSATISNGLSGNSLQFNSGTITGNLTVGSMTVQGALSSGSFNPSSISTGALSASSANITGTLTAGSFSPSSINTGAITASSASISGTLSAGSFSPSSISTGAISASSATVTGTLTAGSFSPSSISTGNVTSTGVVSAPSVAVAGGGISTITVSSSGGTALDISDGTSVANYNGISVNFVSGQADGAYAAFKINSSLIGSIAANLARNGVVYSTTSDQRLKIFDNDIQPEESGRIIDKLEAVWFRWKSDPSAPREPGFFAQAVHKIYEWAVMPGKGKPGEEDFRPWQMDAAKLMPLVIAELKHLRARVAELEDRR